MNNSKGILIIIGGAEDKSGEGDILKHAAGMLSAEDTLTVLTTATEKPEEVGRAYYDVFRKHGVNLIQICNINTREDAANERNCSMLSHSSGIFITGGDQLRITSILGGTRANAELKKRYDTGGVIMGTSAGASVMSSTMIVQGNDNEPARKCTLKMAPGLGLLNGLIIDQHFDQRGRFGRLLVGVAENPDVLGIGIDENTAIKVFPDMHFEVIGSNAVTVIDGRTIQSSNVSELSPNEIMAIIGVTVHALPGGYGYNLNDRSVIRLKNEQ